MLWKKRTKIWLVVMKKWQREHMGFNRQVEAREQVEQIRTGEKKQLKISFFLSVKLTDGEA